MANCHKCNDSGVHVYTRTSRVTETCDKCCGIPGWIGHLWPHGPRCDRCDPPGEIFIRDEVEEVKEPCDCEASRDPD